jgi:aspartate ammonia-lyase
MTTIRAIDEIEKSLSLLGFFVGNDDDMDIDTARHLVGLVRADINEHMDALHHAAQNLVELRADMASAGQALQEHRVYAARVKSNVDETIAAISQTISLIAAITSRAELHDQFPEAGQIGCNLGQLANRLRLLTADGPE